MRDLIGFVLAFALLASPLSVSAQGTDKGWVEEFYPELAPREAPQPPPPEPASEPTPEEPAPEPAPGEPALQLKLDDSGVEVAPGHRPTFDEMELRVKRARIGVFASTGVLGLSTVFIVVGAATNPCFLPTPEEEASCRDWSGVLLFTGMGLVWAGIVGLIVSGGIMAHRKRKLRERKREEFWLRQARYGTPRRAQWDVAGSRLVF
jgi:hypothetical protein